MIVTLKEKKTHKKNKISWDIKVLNIQNKNSSPQLSAFGNSISESQLHLGTWFSVCVDSRLAVRFNLSESFTAKSELS